MKNTLDIDNLVVRRTMIMKKLVTLTLLFCLFAGLKAQTGYSIALTLKPFKNSKVYLGYYYGTKKALADSAMLDQNSKGVFKGKKALPGGIYFVVSPRMEILFELLLDKQQQFQISADTAKIPASIVFTNSPENSLFLKYSKFAGDAGLKSVQIGQQLVLAKGADSVKLLEERKKIAESVDKFRDSIIKKNPQALLATLFKAMRDPVIPPADKHPGGKYDSVYAYNYYKSHFWDGISFYDERLIRTPFLENKLNRYFKELVVPAPDSLIKEVDRVVVYSRANDETFKYYMVYFVQKYINPEYMGQDAVFVHLFEKYINTGQTNFFTKQYMDFMTKRAYSLMANLIGQPAANLEMVDTTDRPFPLYAVQAPLTVVCFWDPTCSHCKETVPRVDSMYKAKWKALGVAIYGVMTDGGKDNWKEFIQKHDLSGWYHVYQTPAKAAEIEAANKPGYKQLYDVYQTPILYLLDKDKRIVAKKLSYDQLDEVITLKLKSK
ncbi:MAG: DUF5106 domain-containing protein [Chitinophagaceae bacterium]|nr:DUF5106 domain-containing protein [Chitinophagaceae bacterium]